MKQLGLKYARFQFQVVWCGPCSSWNHLGDSKALLINGSFEKKQSEYFLLNNDLKGGYIP